MSMPGASKRVVLTAAAAAAVFIGAAAATALSTPKRKGAASQSSDKPKLRPLRLAVLNPLDGSRYNRLFCCMFHELLIDCGYVGCELVEFDVRGGEDAGRDAVVSYPDDYTSFDGVVIPGSSADAFDPAKYPFIPRLEATIRALNAARVPMLGICFGHQVIATALGGNVERNSHPTRAAAEPFTPTALGASLGLPSAEATLLYHHNDVVTMPGQGGEVLGSSATNPVEITAYGADGDLASGRCHAVTFQAHPEFSTATGVEVLTDIIMRRDAPRLGDEWAKERLASIGSEGRAHVELTARAMRLLFDERGVGITPDEVVPILFTNAVRLDFDAARRLDFGCVRDCAAAAAVSIHRGGDDRPADEDLLARLETAQPRVVINKEIPLTAALIERFPASVELIQEAGTGYNNVDVEAAKARGITVCNVPAYSTDQMGQLAVTLILSLSSSLTQQQRMIERGDTSNFDSHVIHVPHFEPTGKVLGLVGGLGDTGSATCKFAQALGLKVIIWSRSAKSDPARGIEAVASLDELLARSDFVSLHCPLNTHTRGMINAEKLRLMKPTAYLVNISRGGLIVEGDLIAALEAKAIAGAALDVQEVESPWHTSSPLYKMDNVILTPHIGWKRTETRQRLLEMVADSVSCFLKGEPKYVVA